MASNQFAKDAKGVYLFLGSIFLTSAVTVPVAMPPKCLRQTGSPVTRMSRSYHHTGTVQWIALSGLDVSQDFRP